MAAPQQFSLRWNNYSQHIVTALDDLRADDELTDVTLSCDGQRLKAHKVLLAACSSFFRDTFKDNPCKHPIIIIKGVSFTDLEAVVTFMYNGTVNVSQDRLQTFLSAAELLQIKGLTDVNDKDEPAKKRPAHSAGTSALNHNSSLSHSASRSGTPDNVQRPPSPKRKRAAVDTFPNNDGASTSSGAFGATPNNVGSPATSVDRGSNGTGGSGGLNSSAVAGSQGDADERDPFQPKVSIKYEDEQDDEEYDEKANMSSEDNDNSMQDMMCNVEPGSIGSFMGGTGTGIGTSGTDSSHGRSRSLAAWTGLLENDDDGDFLEVDEDDFEGNEDEDEEGGNWGIRGLPLRDPNQPHRPPNWKRGEGGPHKCPLCDKTFLRISSLRDHKKSHYGTRTKVRPLLGVVTKAWLTLGVTQCHICQKLLSTVANLKNHYIAVHMQVN